jgi:hypothetical protein
MTNYYIAKFESGVILKRSTKDRTYTTAWRRVYSDPRVVGTKGWSSRPDLAVKAAGNTTAEFADAVEVSSKVFRATKATR